MTVAASPESTPAPAPAQWLSWADRALVFVAIAAVFFVHSGGQVPEPNEPHYLAKAKHFWQPDWIADDFFLDSADSHWVFYVTLGWLSRWLSLPALAWTGRIVTWALVSVAWRRLSYTIAPRFGLAALSAAAFVCLNEGCHMSGEWVVGGFEAKGIAYALVLAALAEIVRDRWNSAWLLLGAAAAMHVLIGGWTCVAAGFCWITAGDSRTPLRAMMPGLIGGFAIALVGLAPALMLTWASSPAIVAEANHIYVYHRLPHHLYFSDFPWPFQLRHTLLLASWIGLCLWMPADEGRWRLRRCVAGAVLIAVVGVVISLLATWQPVVAARLLRFYWFRLSDVFLPLGVALEVAALLNRYLQMAYKPEAQARDAQLSDAQAGKLARPPSLALRASKPRGATGMAAVILMLAVYLAAHAYFAPPPGVPRADKPGKVSNYDDWRAACQWAAESTPRDARFLTPRGAQTFKWYAGRGEIVTWKDIPQDAVGIVEWWRRLKEIYAEDPTARDPQWRDSLAELDAQSLRRLGAEYDAGFVLTEADPPLELPSLYRNDTYAIYPLQPVSNAGERP